MNISKREQHILHELALGGSIQHARGENGKVRDITPYTRNGHCLLDYTMPVFLCLKKRRFIRSTNGSPYRASRAGIKAVRAQLNQR
ncbi:YjhX family toxin [uncultured Tateyamaria sp.]|uniref:YjhX family toxin n=1 Tax=uncultured Tateyamaria sp. TaxID=455651 RepID=UPI00262747D9|nr:YjhX family toxin [uncultured Tateyamaria sp.]